MASCRSGNTIVSNVSYKAAIMAKLFQYVKYDQRKLSQLTAKSFYSILIFSISALRISALFFKSADSSGLNGNGNVSNIPFPPTKLGKDIETSATSPVKDVMVETVRIDRWS